MKHRITIAAIFLTQLMYAQVPGYMGKRFSLGYSNNFFIAGLGPTATQYTGINTVHSFNAEYSIKNRTNFCLSFQVSKTGMAMDREFYQYMSGSNYSVSYYYKPSPDVPMLLQTKSLGIGFKFFAQGTLAPLGKYRKLELLLMFTHLTYPDNSFSVSQYDGYTTQTGRTSLGSGDYNFKTFAINYTIGRQRVLLNCLVLDYGVQFGLMPAGLYAYTDGDEVFSETSSSKSYEEIFKQEKNKRLFRAQMFNFHIGLGFLAF